MTEDRPALPALDQLAAVGEALMAESIRDWLSKHGREDPEAAHAAVDEMLLAALRSIRDGHPDPRGVAAAVLTITEADFPRWSA